MVDEAIHGKEQLMTTKLISVANIDEMLATVQPPHAGFMEQLREAAQRPMSDEEIREQKISFVHGQLPKGSKLSREDVAALIDSPYA